MVMGHSTLTDAMQGTGPPPHPAQLLPIVLLDPLLPLTLDSLGAEAGPTLGVQTEAASSQHPGVGVPRAQKLWFP